MHIDTLRFRLKAFDNGFGTAAWCFINKKISNYKATMLLLLNIPPVKKTKRVC